MLLAPLAGYVSAASTFRYREPSAPKAKAAPSAGTRTPGSTTAAGITVTGDTRLASAKAATRSRFLALDTHGARSLYLPFP